MRKREKAREDVFYRLPDSRLVAVPSRGSFTARKQFKFKYIVHRDNILLVYTIMHLNEVLSSTWLMLSTVDTMQKSTLKFLMINCMSKLVRLL